MLNASQDLWFLLLEAFMSELKGSSLQDQAYSIALHALVPCWSKLRPEGQMRPSKQFNLAQYTGINYDIPYQCFTFQMVHHKSSMPNRITSLPLRLLPTSPTEVEFEGRRVSKIVTRCCFWITLEVRKAKLQLAATTLLQILMTSLSFSAARIYFSNFLHLEG